MLVFNGDMSFEFVFVLNEEVKVYEFHSSVQASFFPDNLEDISSVIVWKFGCFDYLSHVSHSCS